MGYKQKTFTSMNNQTIPISKHQNWFDAIVRDDVERAINILSDLNQDEQNVLLNNPFNFEDEDTIDLYSVVIKQRIILPFHLAMSFCASNMVKFFLSKSVDVTRIDDHTRNVLHSCITLAFTLPNMEKSICGMVSFLVEEVALEDWMFLQQQENADGLRPIEYASQQGCLHLMKTLLESKGYVVKEDCRGVGLFRKHDITEYELGDRYSKSPLYMLSSLDVKKLTDPETTEIILCPLVKGWIDRKIRSSLLPAVVMFSLRLLFITSYIALDADVSWLSNKTVNGQLCPELSFINLRRFDRQSITVVIFVLGTIALFYDCFTLIRYYIKRFHLKNYDLNGKKMKVNNTAFFCICSFLLKVVILFCSINYMIPNVTGQSLGRISLVLVEIVRGLVPLVCFWSLSYFFQLIPYMGFSIIIIQRMTLEMVRFMILFLLILLPFVHVFESFVQANSMVGCINEFSSVQMTTYTLFRIMLSSYDVTTLEVHDIGVIYMFHTIFIFVIAVLLLNFLIALMSSSTSIIAENEKVILTINQLALVVNVEESIFWYTKWLYKILRKRSFHHKDGMIFITSVTHRKDLFKRSGVEFLAH